MAKTTFSFAIGEENNALRSSIWKIVANKSDVFVMQRNSGGIFKTSLHSVRDGVNVCLSGLTQEAVTRHGFPSNWSNRGRITHRWIRPASTRDGAQIALAITFPHSHLAESYPAPKDVEVLLPSPPAGTRIEIFLAYSLLNDTELLVPAGARRVAMLQLTSGEYVHFITHLQPFSQSSLEFLRAGGTTSTIGRGFSGDRSKLRLTLRYDAGDEGYGKFVELGGPALFELLGGGAGV